MSIEQLLFFAILVAMPLLERLIRVMRARTGGSSGDRTPAPAGETGSPPRPPMSLPDAGATASPPRGTELPLPASPLPPTLPQPIPHLAAGDLRASAREPRVRREPRPVPSAGLRAGRAERPPALRPVIGAGDLRRAIVLMAVLGPCRALEPNDASQPR
jgi:hypothetical protein